MTITKQNAERLTLTEMQEFIEGSRAVEWTACGRTAVYDFLRLRTPDVRFFRKQLLASQL